MRLFLSSEQGSHNEALLKLVGDNRKMIYISNAQDDWDPDYKIQKIAEHKIEFESLGFDFHVLDLREHVKSADTLKESLSGSGLIWGTGGNTFLLRRAMKDSGFDIALNDLLSKDSLVYGGSSAGSIVATPSLRGTELGDDPSSVANIYSTETEWSGLSLIPFYFVPHVDSVKYGNGEKAQKMINYFQGQKLPYKALKDGQVYIMDGKREELLK